MTRLVTALLFVSGATGLIYELVWSKYLTDLLGHSGQAHSVVLATFMGGLALGAWAFGRVADRSPRPLALYGALELAVGLYALAFPWVLAALKALYLAVAPAFPEGARVVPRLVISAISLVIPTVLMGGTLPVLLKHITDTPERIRALLARLYAVNSLGAAIGVFSAGVWLVPGLGLSASGRLAAAVNLALGTVAMLAGRQRRPPNPLAPPAPAPTASDLSARVWAVRVALLGVAATGFCSMVYELAWIRLLTLVLGASAYAFTLILTAFVLGIGLGSFVMTRRENVPGRLSLFGLLQLGLVLSICLTLPLYLRLPHLFWVASHGINRSLMTWPVYQGLTFAVSCLVLLLPAIFLGAAFPVGARIVIEGTETLGRKLGSVYLFNTLGTVSGSLLGGLWMLPALSMEWTFAVGLAINLVGAAAALALGLTGPLRVLSITVGAACVGLFVAGNAGWAKTMANMSAFREYEAPFSSYRAYLASVDRNTVVDFYSDDAVASVVVGHVRDNPKHQYMRINGKVDASTSDRDLETQLLAAHLGALLHERAPKKVLLIGAGAALTAGAVLTHPIEQLDMVEISPAVIEGAKLFKGANRAALEDPRLHVFIDDAKDFLALRGGTYDLIISVPSNPWVTGVSGLFSREFFEVMHRHLADDGLLVQWLHTYESSPDLVQLVVRTMRTVFPHGTSWGGEDDLVMVASKHAQQVDAAQLAARIAVEPAKSDLARIRIHDILTLLFKQVHTDAAQKAWGGQGDLNTDDRNRLEYEAPVAFFLRSGRFKLGDQRREPKGTPTGLALEGYLREHPLTVAQAKELSDNIGFFHPDEDPLVRSTAEAWLALAPDDEAAKFEVARAALATGDVTAAHALADGAKAKTQVQWQTALTSWERSATLSRSTFVAQPAPEWLEAARPAAKADPALAAPWLALCKRYGLDVCP